MSRPTSISRRGFITRNAYGIFSGLLAPAILKTATGAASLKTRTKASLVHGESRAENTFKALKLIEKEIAEKLPGKKRIVLKPNFVTVRRQLAATHVDCIEAILEFLGPLVKPDVQIIVAESPAGASAAEGFSNYGYNKLKKQYKVKLLDLDKGPSEIRHVVDGYFYPRAVRVSKLLLDKDTFLISPAVMKTHDRVIMTLSLKNVAVGGVLKDPVEKVRNGNHGRGVPGN